MSSMTLVFGSNNKLYCGGISQLMRVKSDNCPQVCPKCNGLTHGLIHCPSMYILNPLLTNQPSILHS